MKKVCAFFVLAALFVVPVSADIIGFDSFDYAEDWIVGQIGGDGWGWDNTNLIQTDAISSWENIWGTYYLENNSLITNVGGVWRKYNTDEGVCAFRGVGVVYYGVTYTQLAANPWSGISGYDYGSERVFFGQPGGQSTPAYFGVQVTGGATGFSNIEVVPGVTYRLVTALDFDGDQLRMWVDPDGNDYDNGASDNSADAVVFYDATNWNTGVRCASGGPTQWDDLMVANSLNDVLGYSLTRAQNPTPANGAVDVELDNVVISWNAGMDPNGLTQVNPTLVQHEVYARNLSSTDPNYYLINIVDAGDPVAAQVEFTLGFPLEYDGVYQWRVDEIYIDPNGDNAVIEGFVWGFEAKKSVPVINSQTAYQIVDAGSTAIFSVDVTSISTTVYQWYKVDGVNGVALVNGGDILGADTANLEIANLEIADEGTFYCVIINDSGVEAVTENAMLGVKRMMAHWPLNDNHNNVVEGSPESLILGEPVFVDGVIGGGLDFVGDSAVYSSFDSSSYYDICENEITVSTWVKTPSNNGWNGFISRQGESDGWQLRQHSSNYGCFTARGLSGNVDGSESTTALNDDEWHLMVGTYDGAVKNLYIDGILEASDPAAGKIAHSVCPVVLGGRAWVWETEAGYDGFANITLDDVRIYNYAVSANDVAQMYADTMQVDVCPENPTFDLDGDCMVSLNDLAMIASQWMMDNTVRPAGQ